MQNKEKNKQKKQFRLRGKKLLLIYSLLNINSLEDIKTLIFEQLKNKLPKIIQYIITGKKNKEGYVDYYIYLEFNQRVELYGLDCLDLELGKIKYQGKYTTVRKKDIIIKSMIETNNFIAEPKLHFLEGELYLNFKEFLVQLHKKNKLGEIKNYLNI